MLFFNAQATTYIVFKYETFLKLVSMERPISVQAGSRTSLRCKTLIVLQIGPNHVCFAPIR